jgi:DNA-binding beta-propeller fold protein YncE
MNPADEGTLVGYGGHRYSWREPWSRDSHHHTETAAGWAHHGIVVTAQGKVLTPDAATGEMLVLDLDGRTISRWPLSVVQAHGLTLVTEDDIEFLWIADNGSRRVREDDGTYTRSGSPPLRGAAVRISLDGDEAARLPMPSLHLYETADYCPTAIAVDEQRYGGAGDIWVADGYGQSLVHRFDGDGYYRTTIDGEQGAGRFTQPHAVFIDRRRADPELLVADRANRRIQVFDLDGKFLRVYGTDYLVSPSGFALSGDYLIVAELDGRLTVVDRDDRLVGYLGWNAAEGRARPGWPNRIMAKAVVRPELRAGEFNSPHGIAVDATGNVYVTEFLVGGRLVKLELAR